MGQYGDFMADIDYTGMVRIPCGTFKMGSEAEYSNESPAHEVEISSFYLDQCEVTNEEYLKVVSEHKSRIDFDGPNQPVTGVSWFEAYNYCSAIGKQLPTEAQWEYAATAGGKNKFGTKSGDLRKKVECEEECKEKVDYDTYATCKKECREACYNNDGDTYATCDVKAYPPNEFGLYGMAGNAREWVADVYGEYAKDAIKDPTGPTDGHGDKKKDMVLRDGSYLSTYTRQLRAAYRLHFSPDAKGSAFGFRCAAPDMPEVEGLPKAR